MVMIRPTAPGPRPSGSRRFASIGLAVAMAAAVFGQGASYLMSSRSAAIAAAHTTAGNLARTLEEQARHAVIGAELVLTGFAAMALQDPSLLAPNDLRAHNLLAAQVQRLPQARSLIVTDGAGRIILDSSTTAPPPLDLSDRDYVAAHMAAEIGLHVGRPVKGRTSGRPFIPVSMALRQGGRLLAVIVAVVEPDYFSAFYRSLDIGAGGAVALYRADGTRLVRSPETGAEDAAQAPPPFAALLPTREQGSLGHALPDGRRAITGYRRVAQLPLVVSVSLDEADVLASWRGEVAQFGGVAAVLALMLGVLLVYRERQHRLRDADQARLRDSEAMLAETQRVARLGSWHHDLRSGALRWSDETFRIAGQEPAAEAPDFDAYLATVHPDDRPLLLEAVARLARDGTAYALELRHRRPDGGWNHVLARGKPVREEGAVVRVVGSVLDIAERKQAEDALRESRAFARQIADLSPNMLYILALPSGALAWANRDAWAFLGGEAAARTEGSTFAQRLFHPDDHPFVFGRFGRLAEMADDETLEFELQTRSADGEWRWLWYREKVFRRSGDGRPLQILGTAQDVTERRRNEQQLAEAKAAAEAAARAKGQFLAMMSHEIRSPMTAVMGTLDLLADSPLGAEQRRWVEAMGGQAAALRTVLDDILDFSKIEAGHLSLEAVDFAPAELVGGVAALYAAGAAAKSVAVRHEIAPGVPAALRGDPTRLRQVLSNLVSNAVKFTEAGEVLVAADALPEGTGWRLRLTVRDTGIGIPAELQPRLFLPFVQADGSTTRRYGGTGLGLSISRLLVEAMGGTIAIESAAGRGSAFTVDIPVGAAVGGPAAAPDRPAAVRGLRLLLVDDVEANRLLIGAMLERAGHSVTAVDGGAAGVAAVKAGGFDAVLMDVQMPEVDGIEATRRIRALPAPQCRVPVVALSADVLSETRALGLAAGIDAYLGKPVDWAELGRTLDRLTAGRPPARPPGREALDLAVIGQLRGLIGAKADEMLAELPAFIANQMATIAEAAERGDANAARAAAHALRGPTSSFGLTGLTAALLAIKGGEIETVLAELPAIRAEAEAAEAAIAAALRSPAAA
ncbi:MAG TPA: ATP-binding protein [Alphaproteobacteria bacterium]|nr:ATP-binding protein [Alphaproteobacteria bacterium]